MGITVPTLLPTCIRRGACGLLLALLLLAQPASAAWELVPGTPPVEGFVTKVGRDYLENDSIVVIGRAGANVEVSARQFRRSFAVETVLWGECSLASIDLLYSDEDVFDRTTGRVAIVCRTGNTNLLSLKGSPQALADTFAVEALDGLISIERSRSSLRERVGKLRSFVHENIGNPGSPSSLAVSELLHSMQQFPDAWGEGDMTQLEAMLPRLSGGQAARLRVALYNLVTLVIKPNVQVELMMATRPEHQQSLILRLRSLHISYPNAFTRADSDRLGLVSVAPGEGSEVALNDLRASIVSTIEIDEARRLEALAQEREAAADASAITATGTGAVDPDSFFRPQRK